MKIFLLLLAIAFIGSGCEKKNPPPTGSTDDAKLRPEVAAARRNPSPTASVASPTASP